MSKKSEEQRRRREEEELEQFIAEQKKKRLDMVKRVGVIILCIGLVIAFCFPAIGVLM